ncbi:hypothetical protein MUK42_25814 [Musa troglodytarum]|uniref:MLO-like protein n=1 Tax=Musa troglodytarum TaxID=320322 RepID=A0A9E7H956_9LILI|nr:hypothetical protein MUK42_25814 [Musa troglodytarum]
MAGGGGDGSSSRSLVETPTWAVAAVCLVLVILSIIMEQVIHRIGKASLFHVPTICACWLDASSAIEMMLLGFISLLLTGKVPFVSSEGINQLHIFIFALAVSQILYCVVTMSLGRLKVCFIRQFVSSVPKVDYLTLRHGFIIAHLAPQSSSKFNFQNYIKRSLEEDFKVVVEISPTIWFIAVCFLLFNTHGWRSSLWLPLIPLIIVLMVGTKLQVIITKMAIQIMERGDVVKGVPVVRPGDKLFWFNRPGLLLFLIHFVLFQNAFQLAFFAWSWVLCSYVTLPLYALVTQMGSNLKPTIFDERVATALRKWHHTARKRLKENRRSGSVTPSLSTSRPATPTHGLSPVHLLQYHHNKAESLQTSPKKFTFDDDQYDPEKLTPPPHHSFDQSFSHYRKLETLEGLMKEEQEMKEYGGSLELQMAHETDGISVDFSFDKRQR